MDTVTLALIKSMAGKGGGLPPVTPSDNGKVMGVVDGAWAAGIVRQDFVGGDQYVQYIPIEYDGSSFSCSISPHDIDEGYTLQLGGETKVCPPFANSSRTMIALVDSGVVIGGYLAKLNGMDSDGIKFETSIFDLSGLGMTGLVGQFVLNSTYTSPYDVYLTTWQKEPSKFIVTLTPTALDYSGTMDKTAEEITAAYEAGQEIIFNVVGFPGFDHVYIPAAWCSYETDHTNCAACATLVDVTSGLQIIVSTNDAQEGSNYFTDIYSLTPAS